MRCWNRKWISSHPYSHIFQRVLKNLQAIYIYGRIHYTSGIRLVTSFYKEQLSWCSLFSDSAIASNWFCLVRHRQLYKPCHNNLYYFLQFWDDPHLKSAIGHICFVRYHSAAWNNGAVFYKTGSGDQNRSIFDLIYEIIFHSSFAKRTTLQKNVSIKLLFFYLNILTRWLFKKHSTEPELKNKLFTFLKNW